VHDAAGGWALHTRPVVEITGNHRWKTGKAGELHGEMGKFLGMDDR